MTDERTPLLVPGSPTSSAERTVTPTPNPEAADFEDKHAMSQTDFRWLMSASEAGTRSAHRSLTADQELDVSFPAGLWTISFLAALVSCRRFCSPFPGRRASTR